MKTLIESGINWARIGKHPKSEYRYSMESAYIDRDTGDLHINIVLNFIIPYENTKKIQRVMQTEFPELPGAVLHFNYEDVILSEEEIVALYIEYMIDEINGDYAHLTKTIFPEEHKLKDGLLTIKALGAQAVKQLNGKTSHLFEQLLARDFSLKLKVEFINHDDTYKEKAKEKQIQDAIEIQRVAEEIRQAEIRGPIAAPAGQFGQPGAGAAPPAAGGGDKPWMNKKGNGNGGGFRRAKYTPVEGNRIMGKAITDQPVSIGEVDQDSGTVTIEGTVFRKDSRQVRNEKRLVTLLVTDKKNTICVKGFVVEEKWRDIDEHIHSGQRVKIRGNAEFDTFEHEVTIMMADLEKLPQEAKRKDENPEKRVELHMHTKMSAMDGLADVADIIKTAGAWGHKAIAITDHGVVQAFPEAAKAVKKNKLDLKVIFGMEGYLLDDDSESSVFPPELTIDGEYVVFDLETTGLSPTSNEIIEIGAVKVKNREITDQFNTFVKPQKGYIPPEITKLTGISYGMVAGAPMMDEVFPDFMEFIGDLPLVAHNANFDVSFVKVAASRRGRELNNPKVDTVYMARTLLKELKRHKLNLVAKALDITLENHHRAVDDARCTAEILLKFFDKFEEAGYSRLKDIEKINRSEEDEKTIDYKTKNTNHIILLAQTQEGLKNIYKLVSKSHLDYFYKKPRIPKSVLREYREGILIGGACEAGEIYQAVMGNKSDSELARIIELYDYLEIQPLVNNRFLIEKGMVGGQEELKDINRRIVALGKKYGKPVVATCDAHYIDEEESLYRKILMAGQGYKDAEDGEGLFLRTTEEMLEEFSYLGEDLAREVVIDAPGRIADMVEKIIPVPEGKFPPKIDGAEERLRNRCMETAKGIYGDPLPELVEKRLERELNSIIGNGYAVMYVSAELLVQKSLADGYLVGSRGSVGSSFAATMGGITEVNPLPPHYICENPDCKHSEFILDGSYDCGVDLPDKDCPNCAKPYKKDGFNIPFEVFLGFEGDKEPDIDLNFAGEYQPVAHKFVEEIFGRENVFRAGTIGTVATKTAYGFVLKYFEERNKSVNKWEKERLAEGCTGVRRTTGQHPGGIIIVPRGHEIYEFCPVQHPANDMTTDIITTHFDYHSIDENLLKLDILGHDVPSMIRQLQDITGVDPNRVPLRDEKVNGIFNGIDGLDIQIDDYKYKHGSYGIPEFGTKFVRQMLDDTNPQLFADLVRISGFSHGTDVWLNNAQEFIKSGEATMKEAISTRDDIMNYLIQKGLPNKESFKIMESVRKGKGITDAQAEMMEANNVPEWYIESCRRIKYMFPKAHAVAYVMMSYRIAYYKVYYPAAFYAVFFTMKISDFNADVIVKGIHAVQKRIQELEEKGKEATKKEEDEITVLEVAYEMYARGFSFLPAQFGLSDPVKFNVIDGMVQLPFLALNGVGEGAARRLAEEVEKGPFFSIDDIRIRTKLNKTAIEALREHGVLAGLSESDQLSLF